MAFSIAVFQSQVRRARPNRLWATARAFRPSRWAQGWIISEGAYPIDAKVPVTGDAFFDHGRQLHSRSDASLCATGRWGRAGAVTPHHSPQSRGGPPDSLVVDCLGGDREGISRRQRATAPSAVANRPLNGRKARTRIRIFGQTPDG